MIIAVDYDHTLDFAGWPNVGNLDMDRVNKLIECKKNGHQLILWTCRSGKELDDAVNLLKENGLEFDAVNKNVKQYAHFESPKIVANVYIDDAAFNADRFDWNSLLPQELNYEDKIVKTEREKYE